MILVIDNFDSYVHNLARYIRLAGRATKIVRNDALSVDECLGLEMTGLIISPGPKTPAEAGVCLDLIRALPAETPYLGVCLGHQSLIEAFGGATRRARHPLHGSASVMTHNGKGVFKNIPSPTMVGRYHSLIARPPENSALVETAWSDDGELMAVAHKTRPWFGVQFHPESLLTEHGQAMIDNFVRYCES